MSIFLMILSSINHMLNHSHYLLSILRLNHSQHLPSSLNLSQLQPSLQKFNLRNLSQLELPLLQPHTPQLTLLADKAHHAGLKQVEKLMPLPSTTMMARATTAA